MLRRVKKILFTETGRSGLEAARRSALEIVAVACNKADNVSMWFRMPQEMHTIDEARYAYDLLHEMRIPAAKARHRKHQLPRVMSWS